jgi:hypothetical protein
MLEWQDHIGRSNVGEIVSFWELLPARSDDGIDQDTFLWVNQSTLNPDTVNSIYRETVGKKISQDIERSCDVMFRVKLSNLEEREKQVAGFIYKLNEWEGLKRKLQEKVNELSDKLTQEQEASQDLVSRYEKQIDCLINEKHILSENADKWYLLKSLMQDLVKP